MKNAKAREGGRPKHPPSYLAPNGLKSRMRSPMVPTTRTAGGTNDWQTVFNFKPKGGKLEDSFDVPFAGKNQ